MTGSQLNKIRSEAAECLLISSLATDDKKEMFAKIAEHLSGLAFALENTTAPTDANVASAAERLQLEKIRSDAAECLLLSSHTGNDRPQIFAKTAEHLNSLAREVEETLVLGGRPPSSEPHAIVNDLTSDFNPPVVVSAGEAPTPDYRQTSRSYRALLWLLIIVAASTVGVLFWSTGHVEQYLSLLKLQPKLDRSLVQRENENAAGFRSGEEAVQLRKAAEAAAVELQQERQKTTALTNDLAAARRDLEIKTAKASDETAKLRTTAAATAAELQHERQKTAALANDLATARGNLDMKPAPASKTGDETVQLKNTTETATGQLQQDGKKITLADRSAGATAKPSIAAPVLAQPSTSSPKVDPQAAHLVARAKLLLSQGDIIGARTVLERAIELGSTEASFAIAETYDPRVLLRWNVYGTRGDISKAREYYAKAAAGGMEAARDRLNSLH